MADSGDVQRRARTALATVVLFYALSLGLLATLALVALALLAVAFVARRIMLVLLAVPFVLAASAIVKGLWPRRHTRAPHVQLSAAEAPALFALVNDVAAAVRTAPPDRLVLEHGCSASVSELGPMMGRRERVLSLGVATLSALDVSELRALLGHELAHFAGGDTDYLAKVYAARAGMIRVMTEAEASGGPDDVVYHFYRWLFLRFERDGAPAAREQELRADAVSARVAGSQTAHDSLVSDIAADAALGEWLRALESVETIAVPSNVYEGFRRYLRSHAWRSQRDARLAEAYARPLDPLDRHPPHQQRLDAMLACAIERSDAHDARSSAVLVPTLEAHERALCAMTTRPQTKVFDAADWPLVLAALHQRRAARAQARAPSLDVARLTHAIAAPEQRQLLVTAIDPQLTGAAFDELDEALRRLAISHAESYLATLLVARGWSIASILEEPVLLQRASSQLALSAMIDDATRTREGREALVEAIVGAGVPLDGAVAVSPAEHAQHSARWAPVEVRQFGAGYEVKVLAHRARWPRCCVVCKRAASGVDVLTQFADPEHFVGSGAIALRTCEAHKGRAHEHLQLREFDPLTDVAIFDTKDAALAALIERVNA
jgi:Zn-dependent protease with chaperone function